MIDSLQKHRRKSIRLKEWDYSWPGTYFITIVTYQRAELFGDVVGNEIRLNMSGKIIEANWCALEERFPSVELGEFVIMPNHMHAILTIKEDLEGAPFICAFSHDDTDLKVGAPNVGVFSQNDCDLKVGAPLVGARKDGSVKRAATRAAPTQTKPTLGHIVGAFKSISTREFIQAVHDGNLPLFTAKIWQRNYYDRIIRSDQELDRIHQYILTNPSSWAEDEENPMVSDLYRNPSKDMADKLNV